MSCEIINQMQQNMPGSGQCNKPGGKNKKPGKGLPKNAEQLKQQIEFLLQSEIQQIQIGI